MRSRDRYLWNENSQSVKLGVVGRQDLGESLEEAWEIVKTSPRVRDGMLAESARVVEWQVHIGGDRFL